MINKKLYSEYAKLLVQKGLNIKENQLVVINSPVEVYEFTRILVEECYKMGAGMVEVEYTDAYNRKNKINYEKSETLANPLEYTKVKLDNYLKADFCRISLTSPDINASKGIDVEKLKIYSMASSEISLSVQEYFMSNKGQWCVAAVASKAWADQVFPNRENNIELLWQAIFDACHVKEEDTIKSWEKHSLEITKYAKLLNDLKFEKLHFKNELGTDLEICLADKNIFCGGDEYTKDGIRFSPNIPTEEVFGMPHKNKVNGIVYASKPLNYNGGLIEDFYLEFKDGKVVNYNALKGKDLLKSLLEFDDGSSYLGEVALLSYNSPISLMNILFYSTLFDENASCHLALGAAYPTNTLNGDELPKAELEKRGCNFSKTHVDFMFGTADLEVTGTTLKGEKIVLFKNGDFVI